MLPKWTKKYIEEGATQEEKEILLSLWFDLYPGGGKAEMSAFSLGKHLDLHFRDGLTRDESLRRAERICAILIHDGKVWWSARDDIFGLHNNCYVPHVVGTFHV